MSLGQSLALDQVAAIVSINLYFDFFGRFSEACTSMWEKIFFFCFDQSNRVEATIEAITSRGLPLERQH